MDKSIIINYKNIEYTIWFSNDLKLCCNKKIDGNFVMGLDNADKKIISGVFDSLCVSKLNSYFIRSGSVNGVSYNLFYDYNKSLYFTDSFDEGVNSFINLKYNNLLNVYASRGLSHDQFSQLQKSGVFNRKIRNGLVRFSVGLSTSLMLLNYASKIGSGVASYDMFSGDMKSYIQSSLVTDNSSSMVSGEISFSDLNINNLSYVDVDNSSDSITFNDMRLAIESNPNIDSDFKEFFYKLDFAFNDSMKYVSFDSSILDKLKTLKVEYNYDSSKGDTANGEYYAVQNKIVYYRIKL